MRDSGLDSGLRENFYKGHYLGNWQKSTYKLYYYKNVKFSEIDHYIVNMEEDIFVLLKGYMLKYLELRYYCM